jgi:hypothetical protein
MTYDHFRDVIFRLAAATGCAYNRIDAGAHHTPDDAPVRTYCVTLFEATPERFARSDFEKVGASNFRHNPARRTITFDIDVAAPWAEKRAAEEELRTTAESHPTVRRVVAMLGGRVEVVEAAPSLSTDRSNP